MKVKNPIGIIFGGFWGALGGWFSGIMLGLFAGWLSGKIIWTDSYSLILVGAAFGGIIGVIGGIVIGALAGNISSKEENRYYGQKLSRFLVWGLPIIIMTLSCMTIITKPIHSYLLSNFIVPFLQRPAHIPSKSDLVSPVKYDRLPIWDEDNSNYPVYHAIESSAFEELRIFNYINSGRRYKESPLLLIDDTVFIVGYLTTDDYDWGVNYTLISADVVSGEVNWQSVTDDLFLATNGEYIFAEFPANGNTGVIAYDKDSGDVVWQTPLPFGVAIGTSYLTMTRDTLSVKTYHRRQSAFFSLAPLSGKILASRENIPEQDIFTFMIDDGTTYEWFGASMKASGKNEWETEFSPDHHYYYPDLAAPVVANDIILISRKYPSYGPITAIDRQSGSVIWEIASTAVSNIAVDGAITYFVTKDAELLAVDTLTGENIGSVKFTPDFGKNYDFANNAVLVAADGNTIVVYFEDTYQLSILHFNKPVQ